MKRIVSVGIAVAVAAFFPLIAPAESAGVADAKVIYGADDRVDWYEVADPELRAVASSVCILVERFRLTNNGDGTFTGDFSDFRPGGLMPCPTEPFNDQPVLGFCSGFLVDDDVIATAAHCYSSFDLNQVWFVFGFHMNAPGDSTQVFDSSQVYRGVEILGRELRSTHERGVEDWAVIRLDRPVVAPGAFPLPIRETGSVSVGEPVGIIGHPSGLPKKIAFGVNTSVRANFNPGFFEANLDAYGGNSGSPIINQDTLVVEGILVRGQPDFVQNGDCAVSNRLSDFSGENGQWEEATKTSLFAPLIVPIPGDINKDGHADAADVQIVINAALGILDDEGADLDENGRVSAVDIQLIINFALGLS